MARFLSSPPHCDFPPGTGSDLDCLSLTIISSWLRLHGGFLLLLLLSADSPPSLEGLGGGGESSPLVMMTGVRPGETGQIERTICMPSTQLSVALPCMF